MEPMGVSGKAPIGAFGVGGAHFAGRVVASS